MQIRWPLLDDFLYRDNTKIGRASVSPPIAGWKSDKRNRTTDLVTDIALCPLHPIQPQPCKSAHGTIYIIVISMVCRLAKATKTPVAD